MFRRLLLQDLYRVHGKMFGRLHKVGLASHIRNENFVEVCRVHPILSPAFERSPREAHYYFLEAHYEV
jgi:hypothetical protein